MILIGYWADNTACPTPLNYTPAELEGFIGPTMDQAANLHCTIDGVRVKGLSDGLHTAYRTKVTFDYTVPPANNIILWQGLDCYAATGPTPSPIVVSNAVADGVYVFLEPLAVGSHTLQFGGTVPGFTEDATYQITVTKRYSFTKVATLGDAAPGTEGGVHEGDFEPYAINERGEVAFASDLSTGGEGLFVGHPGHLTQLMRAGEPAPGGGTFGGFGVFGTFGFNNSGDAAFCFGLDPFTTPLGANAGVYRYSHITRAVSAILVPYVTAAPGGGTFVGGDFYAGLNERGTVIFTGKITGADIDPTTPPGFGGLANGVFVADAWGHISKVVRPGDPAPGGSVFDVAENPGINDRGDIAFDAHVAGDDCISLGDQSYRIVCGSSVYWKPAGHPIESIAHQGQPAPGGGTYRLAFGPVLNNWGEFVFIGDLTPPPAIGDALGVFMHTGRGSIAVARPGEVMPGGGKLVRASFRGGNYSINDFSEIVFNAALDTTHADFNNDTIADTGLYVWFRGAAHLVVRSGSVIAGLGTIDTLHNPFLLDPTNPLQDPTCGVTMNNWGQILFQAILTDGRVVLLVATPRDGGDDDSNEN